MIRYNLLPMYEAAITEDDAYYRSIETGDLITVYADLFEMKNFIVSKLIDLAQLCNHEDNMIKIISLLEKV